jgi:acetyl esterase/lipase
MATFSCGQRLFASIGQRLVFGFAPLLCAMTYAPALFAADRLGALVSATPEPGAPLGAAAYRVLYRSTGLRSEPIDVSGTVIVPAGPAPAGGRSIVAWAHPTTGIVERCAPSLALFKFQQIQGLRDMLSQGYVVAATDYPGLGIPGPHPYLVGDSEGRAVLDSIRAAAAISGGTRIRAAVWGHSQGGQAALYAGLLAREYAPEIDLVGVAAAAPATELRRLLNEDEASPGGKNLLAMTLWSWSRVFGAPIERVVDPAAMPIVDRLAQDCLESPIDIPGRLIAGHELQKRFLSVDNLTAIEPWKSLLAANTIGAMPAHIPVFLAQGNSDNTVRPDVTHDYMRKLCAAGSAVRMLVLPDVGHGMIARDSASAAIAWIRDRLAGIRAPSDCRER